MKFNATTLCSAHKRLLGLALLAASAFSAPALQADLTTQTFDGRRPILVSDAYSVLRTSFPREATSVSDGNGGVWTAHLGRNNSGLSDQVVLTHLNALGNLEGQSVIASSPKNLADLTLAAVPGCVGICSVYAAWTDNNNAGVEVQPRLFLSLVNTSGVVWKTEIGPLNGIAKSRPKLVTAGGDVIIAWVDMRNGNPDIYTQRFGTIRNSAGDIIANPIWSSEVAVTTAAGNQQDISIALGLGDNDLFVGFTDESSGGVRVRAQKVKAAAGSVEGPAGGQVLNTPVGSEIALNPVVLSDDAGGFFAAWHQGVHLSTVTVYTSRWGSSLNAIGSVVSVANSNKDRYRVDLSVAADRTGGVILAWVDGRGGNNDIYASRFNSSLQSAWVSGGVKVGTSASNIPGSIPSIVGDGTGGAYVSYAANTDLVVKYIAPTTNAEPAGGFPSAGPGRGRASASSNQSAVNVLSPYSGPSVTINNSREYAGGPAATSYGPADLIPGTNGIVAIWGGDSPLDTFSRKVFAQIFTGAINPSRIATPVAQSPINGAQIELGEAFNFETSAFAKVGSGGHTDTCLAVYKKSDDSLIFYTFTMTAGTTFAAPQGLLDLLVAGQTYYWKACYSASSSEISALSAAAEFEVINVAAVPPTMTTLVSKTIDLTAGETAATHSFTLTDSDGNVDDVVVTATSDKQDTVANADILITGTGANRSIKVTPKATGGGIVTITVTATDSTGLTATRLLSIGVTSALRIEGLQNVQIDFTKTTKATLTVNILDPDAPDLKDATLAYAISDISVVPTANFVIVKPAVIGGSTEFQITAAALGTANIMLTLTDADGHVTTANFTVTVTNGAVAPASDSSATTPGGGGGGGGALSPLVALILAGIAALRRRVRSFDSTGLAVL